MAIGLGFCKKPYPNTFEKGPFLLVRFLWVSKENEQDHWRKTHGFKTVFRNNDLLE
jgi:hypothetical protein